MANSKVQAVMLTPDGHYYLQNCTIRSSLGTVADADRGNQAFHLLEDPTFPKIHCGRVKSWEEVLSLNPQMPPKIPEKTQLLAEDQNAFPITKDPFPSVKQRQYIHEGEHERSLQRAAVQASRADLDNAYLGPVAVMGAVVVTIVACIMALMWALDRFSPSDAPLAMIGFLGIALPLRRQRSITTEKRQRFYYETLYLKDQATGRTYICSVPFDVLSSHLPRESRFIPDVPKMRRISALFGAILVFTLGIALLYNLVPLPIATITSLIVGSPLGGGLGWVLGPQFAQRAQTPIWIAYRTPGDYESHALHLMHTLLPDEVPDVHPDALEDLPTPQITGYTYTHGKGMDSQLFDLQTIALIAGCSPVRDHD